MVHFAIPNLADAQSLARWDWAVVGGSDPTTTGFYDDVRAANPAITLTPHNGGTLENAWKGACVSPTSTASGSSPEWWLRKADGSFASYDVRGARLVNLTAFVPTNAAGRRWNEHLARFVTDCYNEDGSYLDEMNDPTCGCWPFRSFAAEVPNVDLDRNGVRDGAEHGTQWINDTWGAALRDLMSKVRAALGPNEILVGNNGGGFNQWANGASYESNVAPDKGALNFLFSWQNNHFGDLWSIVLVGGAQTDYRLMRRGLTTAMLADHYYGYSCGAACNYTSLWWYDEYSVDLATGRATGDASRKGYLGQPTGVAQKLSNGVWRRDFDNGIALVNMTSSTQTVALGGTFRRIRGTQDPVTNSGATVRSVTLSGDDAIILLR